MQPESTATTMINLFQRSVVPTEIDEDTMAKIQSVPSAQENKLMMQQPEPPIGDDEEDAAETTTKFAKDSGNTLLSTVVVDSTELFLCGMDCVGFVSDQVCWAFHSTKKAVEDVRETASKALSSSSASDTDNDNDNEEREPADENTSTIPVADGDDNNIDNDDEDSSRDDESGDDQSDAADDEEEEDPIVLLLEKPILSFSDASMATEIFTKKSKVQTLELFTETAEKARAMNSADPYHDDNKDQVGKAEKCQCACW